MKAYIFTGQGSQKEGMGEELCQLSDTVHEYLEMTDEVLGYKLSTIMKTGSAEELKQTKYTQPAVFVYSVIKSRVSREFKPDMVAGHSLGEFSALASTRIISFADGLRLVQLRAEAMQKCCDAIESGMAAVLGIDFTTIESVCKATMKETGEVVVPANYNTPDQLVISGSLKGLDIVKERLMEAGARRVLPLRVAGAFHSPLMEPAAQELADAIKKMDFKEQHIPVYQNANPVPTTDPEVIRENLVNHLTSPVKWIETIENMTVDGARSFIEVGPRPILSNMIKKINTRVTPVLM